MSKAIAGAALLAGAAIGAAILTGGFALPGILALTNTELDVLGAVAAGGLSLEAGAIAGALTSNRGMNISGRQAAAFRQIIYGVQRVGAVWVFRMPSGSTNRQLNYIMVIAGHKCNAIQAMYLDGRPVHWQVGSVGNATHNGSNFGGTADGGTYTGPNGVQYNFGGKVYAQAYYGDQINQPNTVPGGGFDTGCQANAPVWGPSAKGIPYLGGCTYVYVKLEYDAALFPGEPEIRFTVEGKDDIYDPRIGTSGFTSNCALIAADILTNTTFGLGDTGAVNDAQLVAAANICDEMVPLAAGGTELRYTAHYHYDTSVASGDALLTMLSSMSGRLSLIGGEWYIWPAVFTTPTAHFDQSIFTGPVQWESNRSFAEVFNKVTGVYVAPNYPYSVSGNFYDGNGFNNGQIQDNFGYCWQPTNYPEYACNLDHGYAADEYLIEDRNIVLRKDISRQACLSAGQAQRLAKIDLLRNRQQGHGVFQMGLAAFQLQPNDTFTVTFPKMGWTNKLVEVVSVTTKFGNGQNGSPLISMEVAVQETDASVYEWNPTVGDEKAVNDQNIVYTPSSYLPVAPENLTLTSSAATALTGADGIVRPRVMVSWDTPQDAFATSVQVQYQQTVAGAPWLDVGSADVTLNSVYVSGVVAAAEYNFRIRSVRPNGATSPWVESDAYTVSNTLSQVTSTGLNPNSPYNVSNTATVNSVVEGSAATIRVYGPGGDGSTFIRYQGAITSTMSAAHITGEAFTTTYFVVFDSIAQNYLAFNNYNSTLADRYIWIGQVITCSSGYTGGAGTGGSGGSSGGGGGSAGGGRNPIASPVQQQDSGD